MHPNRTTFSAWVATKGSHEGQPHGLPELCGVGVSPSGAATAVGVLDVFPERPWRLGFTAGYIQREKGEEVPSALSGYLDHPVGIQMLAN